MRSILAAMLTSALFLTAPSSGYAASGGGSNSASTSVGSGNPTREFVMSCSYGAIAGSLVGAASLAFTSQPGQNLSRIARGASIGLYAGILLGIYVVYIVPGLEGGPEDEPQIGTQQKLFKRLDNLSFNVTPTFRADYKLDGFKADWTVLRF